MRRSLAGFQGSGYDKGRGVAVQAAWMLASGIFVTRWWCPVSVRAWVLRIFGARIGRGTVIRHGVRIHWPWKLVIGDNTWVGEGAMLLNLETIELGSDVCISQQAMLCTGSHSKSSPTFEYDNAPILVGDGSWIAARAVILRGVTVGSDSVIGATALVTTDVPNGAVVLAPRGGVTTRRRPGHEL
jgi:Acetyltransferase (isoleucine patch superfamily)